MQSFARLATNATRYVPVRKSKTWIELSLLENVLNG